MRRVLRTRAILVATSLIAAAAALAIPLSATAAPSPTEVAVFPADDGNQVLTDKIIFGGTTGYLHQPQGTTTYVWTTYGTGQNRVITMLPTTSFLPMLGGADRMAYRSTTGVTEVDFADNTSRTFVLPTGAAAVGVSDNRVLVRATVNGTLSFEVLAYASDGSATSSFVAPPPDGGSAFGVLTQPVGDPPSQVVTYHTASNTTMYALLDLTTAMIHIIPGAGQSNTRTVISADHLAMFGGNPMTVQVYDRADVVAGSQTAPPLVPVPLTNVQLFGDAFGLIGDRFVIRSSVAPFDVSDLRPDGSLEGLVPSTQAALVPSNPIGTADGSDDHRWRYVARRLGGASLDRGVRRDRSERRGSATS